MRLFLLEKGRIQGVTACNRAHRDESHGDTHYCVDRVGANTVRLRTFIGRVAKNEADTVIYNSSSKIAELNRVKQGLDAALTAHKDNAELIGQLNEKIKAAEESIQGHELKIEVAKLVPSVIAFERTIQV